MGYKKGEILKTAFETYAIRGQRGCGGSGEVYEITDGEGSVFAAKILDQAKATRSRLKRFQNEISFCSKIAHRNIVEAGEAHDIVHGLRSRDVFAFATDHRHQFPFPVDPAIGFRDPDRLARTE